MEVKRVSIREAKKRIKNDPELSKMLVRSGWKEIALDLDGTLLRSDATLSPYTISTINRLTEQGLAFTYATARSIESARPIAGELNLRLPAITRNGAVLADNATGKHLEKALFTEEEVALLKKLLPELPRCGFVSCFLGEEMFKAYVPGNLVPGMVQYADYYRDDPKMKPVKTLEEMFFGQPGYVTLIDDREKAALIYEKVRQYSGWECIFQKDTYWDEYWVEVCPRNCTKAKAILKMKEQYGFRKVVAFGDSVNDMPMFRAADEAYAVSNALEALKEIATGVIGGNNEDAVARFLESRAAETEK